MPHEPVIALSRCRHGEGTFVEFDGLELAVFVAPDGQSVVVSDNTCPHSSGNLSAGEHRNGVIVCPLHDWEFDDRSGICTLSSKAQVKVYPSRIADGQVWIDRA